MIPRVMQDKFDTETDIDEELIDIDEREDWDWDRIETLEKKYEWIPHEYCKSQKNKIIVVKPNMVIVRKNACKLISVPPRSLTEGNKKHDCVLKLSSKDFNGSNEGKQKGNHKARNKKENTCEYGLLDKFAQLLLSRMLYNQFLGKVTGVIEVGEEAVVLHAEIDSAYPRTTKDFPKECAIKAFKNTLTGCNHSLLKCDICCTDSSGKKNKRINQWFAKNEEEKLCRMRKYGILCPEVIALKHHVLVTSFIGKDGVPAPKLRDAILTNQELVEAAYEIVNTMREMYKAKLVHTHLSESNILYHNKHCYIIDVSQTVDVDDMYDMEFLYNDCCRIHSFFKSRGLGHLFTERELFNFIIDEKLDTNEKKHFILRRMWKLMMLHKIMDLKNH